jgi:t-SNARE complex subunit (syntaxin)
MNKFEKSMEEIFDISPKVELPVVPKKETTELIDTNLEEDLTDAYEQTKSNLQDLIDQGKDAMEEILQIAKAGQHPRAFEVYGTLLKNVVDANKELLAVQKQMREMDKKNAPSGSTHIDKAIFVGSTSELNKLIKGNNDNK